MNVADTNAHTAQISAMPAPPLPPEKAFLPLRSRLPLQLPFLRPALVPNGETINPTQGAKTSAPSQDKTAYGGMGYTAGKIKRPKLLCSVSLYSAIFPTHSRRSFLHRSFPQGKCPGKKRRKKPRHLAPAGLPLLKK
jgi:hypothetical protein